MNTSCSRCKKKCNLSILGRVTPLIDRIGTKNYIIFLNVIDIVPLYLFFSVLLAKHYPDYL